MMTVSDRAVALIIEFEVSSREVYEKRYQFPTWPSGLSGVTIGIGYDLGQVSLDEFQADWDGHLPTEAIDRLSLAVGVRGIGASHLALELHDVRVPWDSAMAVYAERVLPAYAERTRKALPHTDELSADSFGALVSLVYNRGASFCANGDRYAEMRNILHCMAERDFTGIPAQIRSMKRLWQDVPGMAGLLTRRDREAALFEDGLHDDAAPVVAVTPAASPLPIRAAPPAVPQPELTADDLNARELERIRTT